MQSPEAIAKQYGGNKQQIAQAMQMGIIDPTAGTLAGMFIDRMRSAAQEEQTPQQTVAQQVMAPQPQAAPPAPPMGAPAGLGATPQAAPMGQPPAMGQPSAPPPGMAMGGMVPPYASGGITDLPIPDGMFDEPNTGSYASGGIVAFAAGADGEEVDEPRNRKQFLTTGGASPTDSDGTIVVQPELAPEDNSPESYYGNFRDPFQQERSIKDFYNPKREANNALTDLLKGEGSPEELGRRKKEDMWLALGKIGAKMAGTPGSFLQAASAGMAEALPGIGAAAKERKADRRDAIKTLAQQEGLSNKEALDMFKLIQDGTNKYGEFDIARLTREQQERLEILGRNSQERIARIQAAAGITSTGISASAQRDVGRMGLTERRVAFSSATFDDLSRNAATDPEYLRRVETGGMNAGKEYLYDKAEAITNRAFGGGSGSNDPAGLRGGRP